MSKSMILLAFGIVAMTTACAPEVGTEKWCAAMKEKPKGEWTANEAGDFLKHCVLPGSEVDGK